VEKEQGLPVGPVMDRNTVKKGASQTGFISVFMLPMFKLLTKVSKPFVLSVYEHK